MSVELIEECATAHHGNVALAEEMIIAAADSGAHTVKFQHYHLACLNPADPQRAWLEQSYLDATATERLINACHRAGVQFLSTPFDVPSFEMLCALGCLRFKVASSGNIPSPTPFKQGFIKSYAWGRYNGVFDARITARLITIPLYPTPLEAVCALPEPRLINGWDGYSDHTCGIAACQHMISKGARIIEAHFCLPGKSRQMVFDKTPEQFRQIRDWSDQVQTMSTGVSTVFRERWTA
jgi:sialic acid synthase SpsE